MITVTIKENFEKGFIVEGHAGYAEHGQDIVCASVSAITQTATMGLLYYTKASRMMGEGYLEVEIHEFNESAKVIVDTMYMGLKQIKEHYSEYIQFKEE